MASAIAPARDRGRGASVGDQGSARALSHRPLGRPRGGRTGSRSTVGSRPRCLLRSRIASADFSDLLTRISTILTTLFLALPNIAFGIVVFGVFAVAAWLLGKLVRSLLARAGQPPGVRLVLSRLTTWVVLALGLSVAVTVVFPALNAASLFGALGLTSVAIGFAFKDIFQNLLAGLLILLTRPFTIGDQIVSGDSEGTVEDILVRATLLKTYDGRRIVIPNSELYTNRVVVNTAFPQRRLAASVGIGNDEDIPTAKAVILDAVGGLEGVLGEPAPQVVVTELGDFSVLLEVRWWISPPARHEAVVATSRVLEAVKAALDERGIEMPYPIQQLRVVEADRPQPVDQDAAGPGSTT